MNKSFLGILNMQQGETNKMSQFNTGHLQVKTVCGVVFTEPQEEVSLMYRMTSWKRSKDPFNSEGGMEEKVKGGPPEEKEQKREEVEKKENENVQKPLEERISSLEKELEAANGRYKCLLQELETLKKENLNKLSDFEQQNIQLREELEKLKSEKNVSLKDELLAANEIILSLKEELEGRDKKKENRPGMRKVRLNRTSLEISTEMDIKDGQKAIVQKDVRDNKSEEKVVEAQDQDPNGRKAEKEKVAGESGVGQVLGWLLASKGALPETNNRQEEQKLEKETSRDEEEEEKEEEEEEKEEEEKQKEEKIAKTTRKPIMFDLEPEKPKSSHITFQGEKVRATTTGTVASTGTWLST
ncbi:uncharacterized protein [Palaemon carinicauda]|uniref:uncharacterized protein n=1 Tax=Palaemon carinicauda TaxID=392227 RepID=UPI0035B59F9D